MNVHYSWAFLTPLIFECLWPPWCKAHDYRLGDVFCQGKCEVFPVIKGTPHHARSASEPYKLKGGKSLMWEKNLHRPLSSYQGKPNRTYQVLNPHGCLPGGTFHPFRGLSLDFLFYIKTFKTLTSFYFTLHLSNKLVCNTVQRFPRRAT